MTLRTTQYSDLSNPALDIVTFLERDSSDSRDPDFSEAFRYHRRYRSAIGFGVAAAIVAAFLVGVWVGRQPKRRPMSVDPVDARHRRTLDANDFDLAAKYAHRLKRELRKRGEAIDLDAIEAFWAAVVMSYGRPL